MLPWQDKEGVAIVGGREGVWPEEELELGRRTSLKKCGAMF